MRCWAVSRSLVHLWGAAQTKAQCEISKAASSMSIGAGGKRPSRPVHRPLSGLAADLLSGMPRVTKSAIARPMQS